MSLERFHVPGQEQKRREQPHREGSNHYSGQYFRRLTMALFCAML